MIKTFNLWSNTASTHTLPLPTLLPGCKEIHMLVDLEHASKLVHTCKIIPKLRRIEEEKIPVSVLMHLSVRRFCTCDHAWNEQSLLSWSPACLNKCILMNQFFKPKSKWVGDFVFSIGKTWKLNEIPRVCEGVRLSELCRIVSSIPNMPTHIKSCINAVSVYSQCKTPWAENSAKCTAIVPRKNTPVTFINFGHLRTENPAKNSFNPLVSQQKQQRWKMCLRHRFQNQPKMSLRCCCCGCNLIFFQLYLLEIFAYDLWRTFKEKSLEMVT